MTDHKVVHVQRVFICDYYCELSDYTDLGATTEQEIHELEMGVDEPSMFADMLTQVSCDVTILPRPE